MTNQPAQSEHLCYLEPNRLEAPLEEPLEVRSRDDQKLGTFEGVVVDPSERSVRYYVVNRGGLFPTRRLMPVQPARIDLEHHALRLQFDDVDPSQWEKFDSRKYPPFSDDDLITAIFAH